MTKKLHRSADQGYTVVGIGASAGGLAAFESFFTSFPPGIDLDMAFILIQHLSPDHESILSNLIRHYTSMPVYDVENGMIIQPNCIYIIQPNRYMTIINKRLQLIDPTEPYGHRLPIDFFFRSLAMDQKEKSICIILSGNGSDGTAGLRDIKAEGGMVIAQTVESSEYNGMPTSAIATGLVDFELLPSDMSGKLLVHSSLATKQSSSSTISTSYSLSILKTILVLLRMKTGHDFSLYKPNTIYRRIERRMLVHQIQSTEDYILFLQRKPEELDALFDDLLIGVTKFFRDPETFNAIEKTVIPKIFANKTANDEGIRVWCAGCSTGEEAYTLAILFHEHMGNLKQAFHIQIFATDIDNHAISTARAGLFPLSIANDIQPERLSRFFTFDKENNTYQIHRSIRDMVIFSTQDIIKDPPFSRLDMISCRNLMIYMGGELQKKLIPLFHYTLKSGGILLLGTSESVGDFTDLFSPIGGNLKAYERKQNFQTVKRLAVNQFYPPLTDRIINHPASPSKARAHERISVRGIIEQALLQHIAPDAALVSRQGDILYLYGRIGRYLEPVSGETGVNNILKMARNGLKRELTTLLRKAALSKKISQTPQLILHIGGMDVAVKITVNPLTPNDSQKTDQTLFLIIMDDKTSNESQQNMTIQPSEYDLLPASAKEAALQIATLTEELRANGEYLQAINEELEITNGDLQSSNEEMQSVNEELQSTNEELETSKEEMQSINEELSTMNTELQTKVTDLSQVSNDMNNLLASTGIGTIFVDLKMRIMRFTPAITQIFNLIPSDVGRPIAHTVSNLIGYTKLISDIESVLEFLIPKEIDVETTTHTWYTMRIRPYRTLDNIIEGAVIAFIDITEIIKIRTDLEKANEKLRDAAITRNTNESKKKIDKTGIDHG